VTPLGRRRLLVVLLLATVVSAGLDLSGSGLPGHARSLAAAAIGPVQRSVAAVDPGDSARMTDENAVLRARLAEAEARLAEDAAVGHLLGSPSATAGRLLPARVVGTNATVTGGRQVTLDVGQRDGLEPNLTVVAADGLVGRVVTVGPWSSDVRLLDGADSAVAVRVGPGVLGSVSAHPRGEVARAPGDLTLTLVDRATVAVGDRVTTLGSVGGRPYAPDILVGTVTAVDPPRGQLTGTAAVRPAVDATRLDVVGVVLPPGSTGSRGSTGAAAAGGPS
jgi:rod shape-determining protein MreC